MTRATVEQVGVFHPGVQHSWQTALALQQLGRLGFYATSIFYKPDRWPYRIERYLPAPLAARVHAEFARFTKPQLDPALVHGFGVTEWLERAATRLGRHHLARRLDAIGNRRFAQALPRLIAAHEPATLWGFNGSSLDLFRSPAAQARRRVLDFTSGHQRAYRTIITQAQRDFPDWVSSGGFSISDARIAQEDAECALADRIVVGSESAAQTLRANLPDAEAARRVRVLPYCYDQALFAPRGAVAPPPPDRPVRFLMVGEVSLRKGAPFALEAIRRIPPSAATLTMVGKMLTPPATFARYADRVTHIPPVPRAVMPALMAQADVLLAPSYFEGSSLALLEGLASGLAIIQSPNAGQGATPATGLILPELSVAAVVDAMTTLIDDRPRLAAMQAAASVEAERYSFARYRGNVAKTLDGLG